MINLKTLSMYLFRLYCGYFIAILLLLIGVLIISNIFDILQKFKTIYIPSHIFWKLVLYKVPYLLNEIASLLSFVAMLFFLKRLTKYNELIAILCSGIHIWRVLVVPTFATFIIGIVLVAIVNPIGTLGLQKYDLLEKFLTRKRSGDFVISQSRLLFFENYNNNNRIIQASSINMETKILNDVTVIFLDSSNHFMKRIDARQAILSDNSFILSEVKIITDNNFETCEELVIATNLSINNLVKGFILPEMISIWDLPEVIQLLAKSGLPVTNYKIYYYKQLFKPIMMITTVILAGCFISLKQRDNSQGKMVVYGLFLSFIIYSLLEILAKTLVHNSAPPDMAVLLPNMLILFIASFVVLHSKET